jgi:hypothetical protein
VPRFTVTVTAPDWVTAGVHVANADPVCRRYVLMSVSVSAAPVHEVFSAIQNPTSFAP